MRMYLAIVSLPESASVKLWTAVQYNVPGFAITVVISACSAQMCEMVLR